jgi:hypothetical protein
MSAHSYSWQMLMRLAARRWDAPASHCTLPIELEVIRGFVVDCKYELQTMCFGCDIMLKGVEQSAPRQALVAVFVRAGVWAPEAT